MSISLGALAAPDMFFCLSSHVVVSISHELAPSLREQAGRHALS